MSYSGGSYTWPYIQGQFAVNPDRKVTGAISEEITGQNMDKVDLQWII